MDKFNVDKDNISTRSQGGRNLHTYTPRSHEDLLRSHLQLDAARNAKLLNDVQRLAADNNRLQRELDQARQDLRGKDEEIDALNIKLRRPRTPPPQEDRPWKPDTVVEVDGKPITLEKLINHFNGVIQRHHDLINQKNRQIQQLQDALKNQPVQRVPHRRDTATQSLKPPSDEALSRNLMIEFTNQLEKIKREYEHVEDILTERNDKLEKLIEELQKKLDEYAKEIQHLRTELSTRENTQPSESTMQLLKEKEKENNYLKEIISSLKVQRANNVLQEPQVPNEDLENEIKRIIESKKDTIYKLNSIINEVKSQPSSDTAPSTPGNTVLSQVEKDFQAMITDLNMLNDKLNNMLQKLKHSPIPSPIQERPVDKNNLISNLENLKKQIQDDIDTLNNKIGATGSTADDSIILRGQAVVRIDDPNYLRKRPPESEGDTKRDPSSTGPIESSSNINFVLYPSSQYPQPRKQRVEDVERELPRPDEFRSLSPQPQQEPSDKTKYYPIIPCEACTAIGIPPISGVAYTPQKLSIIRGSIPSAKDRTPSPKRKLIEDFFPISRAKSKERGTKVKPKTKSKGGCCGKKASETSNIPYSKHFEEERVVSIHNPNETPQRLYPELKKDDFTYEFPGTSSRRKGTTEFSPRMLRKI